MKIRFAETWQLYKTKNNNYFLVMGKTKRKYLGTWIRLVSFEWRNKRKGPKDFPEHVKKHRLYPVSPAERAGIIEHYCHQFEMMRTREYASPSQANYHVMSMVETYQQNIT